VRATLSAQNASESLTVRNNGTEPAVVQLEILGWSQQDSSDVFSPTRDILATPPIFTVQPGGSQVIRVGLRRAVDPLRELTYRLFLQEVPQAPKPGFQGLQVALRLSVPVFVNPPVAPAPVLRWWVLREPTGELRVRLTNDGNAHVQVASFQLAAAGRTVVDRQQVSAYVLPGQRRHWVVKPVGPVAAGAVLSLSAATDTGDVQANVAVDKP
jgi:fimbrial chaperone protein